MHRAAASGLDFDLAYIRLPVHPDDLGAAIRGLPALGFRGVNVTIPHKEAVIPLLDEIDPAAKIIGAVNTIVIQGQPGREKRLVGFNSDWSGFLVDLKDLGQEVEGRHCYILGAGGSARAITYALASSGGRVSLFARRIEQAQALIDELVGQEPDFQLNTYDWRDIGRIVGAGPANPLIVNCTPLGQEPNVASSPWPEHGKFPPGSFVYDLVYNPPETSFMRQALSAGCQAANGLGLLVQQGAKAFQLWTGDEPNLEKMATALK